MGSLKIISIGVEATILGASLLAYSLDLISLSQLIPPILLLSGLWIVFLSRLIGRGSEMYQWSPFTVAAWGSILAAAGVLGLFAAAQVSPLILLSAFILFFGILIILVGLRGS